MARDRRLRWLITSPWLVFAILIAACNGQAQDAQSVVPAAGAQAAPSQPPLAAVATSTPAPTSTPTLAPTVTPTATPSPTPLPNPLSIEYMRQQTYPGSDLVIEQTLEAGSNYKRYIASYLSEGLIINALLTVPAGVKPATGWPVIIFNHGYIPPAEYRTTERYVAYVDAFARSGYIVLKSDYRGHGSSEGRATSAYSSAGYTVDVLNAVASIKRFKDADPKRMGMWGHSMGGQITLRSMVVSQDIKAGVIWAGVVAPYPNRFTRGRIGGTPNLLSPVDGGGARGLRFGEPALTTQFWESVSPNSYLSDLSGPIQLQHGTADTSVPYEFSVTLNDEIKQAEGTVEFYSYAGDNHNLSLNLALALQRSVQFFDRYVKARS
jgi:dipeptidyl aminopeptidase/acylaminoacyl peptidase